MWLSLESVAGYPIPCRIGTAHCLPLPTVGALGAQPRYPWYSLLCGELAVDDRQLQLCVVLACVPKFPLANLPLSGVSIGEPFAASLRQVFTMKTSAGQSLLGQTLLALREVPFCKLSSHRARLLSSVVACVSIAGHIAFRWVSGQFPALFLFVRTRAASSLAVYSSSGTPARTASRHHSHAPAHWLGRSQQEQPSSSGFIPLFIRG